MSIARRIVGGARVAHVPLGRLPALAHTPAEVPATEHSAAEPGAQLDELASPARTSLALARQILASGPVLLDPAGALLRTSKAADRAITGIRDLMK